MALADEELLALIRGPGEKRAAFRHDISSSLSDLRNHFICRESLVIVLWLVIFVASPKFRVAISFLEFGDLIEDVSIDFVTLGIEVINNILDQFFS